MLIKSNAIEVKCKGLVLLMCRAEIRYLFREVSAITLWEKDLFVINVENCGSRQSIVLNTEDKRDFLFELGDKYNA